MSHKCIVCGKRTGTIVHRNLFQPGDKSDVLVYFHPTCVMPDNKRNIMRLNEVKYKRVLALITMLRNEKEKAQREKDQREKELNLAWGIPTTKKITPNSYQWDDNAREYWDGYNSSKFKA